MKFDIRVESGSEAFDFHVDFALTSLRANTSVG